MAKRTASHTSTNGPAFPPLGLVAGPGAPVSGSLSMSGMPSAYSTSASVASSSGHTHSNGLPPAPNKFDASQAQHCRLQDAYWSDEEEDMDCPLCLEEIDLSDANFKPCPCGYQICRFCWHHIKQNLNGRCPACRRKYSDQTVEFQPMTADEIKKLTQAKKQKEREKKELEAMNRKHLANMRVVQKNLVYVVGLSSKLAKEELIPTLRSNEYFGQYGRISKILISKRNNPSKSGSGTSESSIGVYVTYHRKEDAAKAIVAIDGSKGSDGRIIRASYGTTKYCTTYLRNLPCTNPGCTYLHEPGEEADSFTKEDLSTLRHAAKDTEHKIKPASLGISSIPKKPDISQGLDSQEASALPKTASWASGKPVTHQPASSMVGSPFRESDMPPLSASLASALARKPSGPKPLSSKPKTPSTPSSKTKPSSSGRAESPAPPGLARAILSSTLSSTAATATSTKISDNNNNGNNLNDSINTTSEPSSPVVSKGSPVTAISSPELEHKSLATLQKATRPSAESSVLPSTCAPPGLGPPSASSSSSWPGTSSGEQKPKSTYQPSSFAKALLDDMLQRREAEPETIKPSPFPDFDYALSSFKDGDFSFNFPVAHQLASHDSLGAHSELTGALAAFSPFGAPPSMLAVAHSGIIAAGTPPPGIVRTPNHSTTASPAPLTYSGCFDPFAPGAGETIKETDNSNSNNNNNLNDDNVNPSPFAAIEQMRRTLTEERNTNSNEETSEGSDASKRASRFEFAKRKESDSLGTGVASSPLRAELMQNMRINGFGEHDHLGAPKDVTSLLGNVFDHEINLASSGLNGYLDSAPHAFGLARDAGGYLGSMGLSRPPPGIGGPAFNARFGTNTPPPGISAPASRQQQALLASLHQMGGSSISPPTDAMQHMATGSGASFLAELQQQAAQRAQQQSQYGAGGMDHSRPNGSASADPLLAQILAAGRRPGGYAQQQGMRNDGGGNGFSNPAGAPSDLPFNDPAIMTMTRNQIQHVQQVAHQQQAQQQQQQQQQPQYGGRYGNHFGNGVGSSFSPFDQLGFATGNASLQPSFGEQRFLHQDQPTGPPQHDPRSAYPALS